MATELEAYAVHCRKMAKATHRPDCTGRSVGPVDACSDHDDPDCVLPPKCQGCITMRDRALWLLLATEAETYLRAHEPETLPL
jgi:hypothetical protein